MSARPLPFNTDCTIVTALFDIGRGDWPAAYQRPFSYYLENFEKKTLSLRTNLVVFIQPEHEAFVQQARRHYDPDLQHIQIIKMPFSELPRQKYREDIKRVLTSDHYRQNALDPERPEYFSLDYNIVIHSKTALVERVCKANPFNTRCFLWMDSAIGHKQFPARLHNAYYPRADKVDSLCDGRIHLVCTLELEETDLNIAKFFLANINRTPADWWAGTAQALIEFEQMCLEITEEALRLGVFDNEESVYTVAAQRHIERFVLYPGERFLALHRF